MFQISFNFMGVQKYTAHCCSTSWVALGKLPDLATAEEYFSCCCNEFQITATEGPNLK